MRQPALVACALSIGIAPLCAQTVPERVDTQAGPVAVEVVTDQLAHPWGLAFLPDERMLVTERPGRLRVVDPDGSVSEPLDGMPQVFAQGQGGLLDVRLDPGFGDNRLVYLTYAEARDGGAATSAGRGRLNEEATAIEDFEVIFRQEPAASGQNHFGSRLAFAPDGRLFVTLGDRFDEMQQAQDPANHIGAIVRIDADGSIPEDNPFVGQDGADEIWSFGHRNVQGAAVHPETGELWVAEHGPRGGDELNLSRAGENYGWPEANWGEHYWGDPIPDPPERPDFTAPVHHWTPAIAPSGMTFYTGDLFPEWQGSLLIGGLVSELIMRVALDGEEVAEEERIELGARIRAVAEGPDSAIYVLTDHDPGAVLRLAPAE